MRLTIAVRKFALKVSGLFRQRVQAFQRSFSGLDFHYRRKVGKPLNPQNALLVRNN